MYDYEQLYLRNTLGFGFVFSGMTPTATRPDTIRNYGEFFGQSPEKAHIVYCDETDKEGVEASARFHIPDAVIIRNAFTREALHGNTEKHVHIVTEQRLMRGFDYRAPTVGFALLIARQLDSKRAFL